MAEDFELAMLREENRRLQWELDQARSTITTMRLEAEKHRKHLEQIVYDMR